MSSDHRVKIDTSLKPFESKTKEEKNAERLQILASSKPYMHKRPEGMSMEDYRHNRRAQNEEYRKRKAPKYFWISQDSYATLMKGLSTGLAMGTYRKSKF